MEHFFTPTQSAAVHLTAPLRGLLSVTVCSIPTLRVTGVKAQPCQPCLPKNAAPIIPASLPRLATVISVFLSSILV